eukprot:scaffold8259_cov143-Cylindrotheca_fusiformis.AAC.23
MQQTNGEWTMKSNRGPEAVAPPPNYQNDSAYYKSRDSGNAYAWAQKSGPSAGGVGGSWGSTAPSVASQARQPTYAEHHQATPSITVSGGAPTNVSGNGGTAVSDGSYEKQLVMELCPPGGMKAEPPPDKLNQFARSVSSLNPDLVCPVLLDCLEDGQPWIIRAKALCVMECCIRNGQKPGAANNPYADFFHACGGEIAPLVSHARAAIRDPAKRVLGLLGIAVSTGVASAPQPAQTASAAPPAAAPPAPVPNLLDFGDSPEPASAPPTTAPPTAPSVDAGSSLFGGLRVTDSQAPTTKAPPTSKPPAAPSSGNLLGDFMSGESSVSEGHSLFDEMQVKSNSAAAKDVSQASSMFSNLAVKSEGSKSDAPAAAPAGSAFDFMNQSASAEPKERNEANTMQPAASSMPASWGSFDPLNSEMTPNTAKQMMQISPQQMQAMAYRQLMMQQQMQMAQMMAMQQQQHGSGGRFMPASGNVTGNMVMQNPAAAKTSFAFLDGKAQVKNDKSFDFVKDAMTMEKKK